MDVSFKNGKLTIVAEYDPTKRYPAGQSGKTNMVENSGGFVPVPGADGLKLSVALIQTMTPEEKKAAKPAA